MKDYSEHRDFYLAVKEHRRLMTKCWKSEYGEDEISDDEYNRLKTLGKQIDKDLEEFTKSDVEQLPFGNATLEV